MAWEDVDIETSLNCRQDGLKVFDGPTRLDDVLANVLGSRLPSAIASSDRRMLARFVTNSNTTGSGFYARYRFVEQYCNEVFTDSGSQFSSPNYPDEYADNTNCSYRAVAELYESITLTFTAFDLEDGNCEFDSVKKTAFFGSALA
ncbi:UVS.2 protein [Apostichopus japonicus]|uniref:UVS.2 protein n=1 Tax=Stichopus japonicus TaxID=307972 RepID=A0A2G8L4D3_STIJA|nr:UVS.2 protein [Apostichopus japonicus]